MEKSLKDVSIISPCQNECKLECTNSCLVRSDSLECKLSRWLPDLEHRFKHGRTAVMLAAKAGNDKLFFNLVNCGCNIFIWNNLRNNLLHDAGSGGSVNIVRFLIEEKHFDPEVQGHSSRTVLQCAVLRGHRKLYEYLRGRNCSLSTKDDRGRNILHMACVGCDLDLIEEFLSRFYIDSRDSGGITPVMTATIHKRLDVFEYLVNRGCNLKISDIRGRNVLDIAIQFKASDIIRELIDVHNFTVQSE